MITLTKLIPINRISKRLLTDGEPTGYMQDSKYVLTQGGDILTRLEAAGERFITITEVPTPIDDKQPPANRLRELFTSLKRSSGTAYQPVMIRGVEAHIPRITADTRLNWITAALAGICSSFEGKSLLDLGCSTGYMARAFDSYGCTVTGVDANATSIELAECANKVAAGNVNFRSQDALAYLEQTSDSYDIVLCLNLMHWLHRQQKWGPLQVKEFVQLLAARTRIAVVLAFFHKRVCMGEPTGINTKDAIQSWGEGQFSSVAHLGNGKGYAVWFCPKV